MGTATELHKIPQQGAIGSGAAAPTLYSKWRLLREDVLRTWVARDDIFYKIRLYNYHHRLYIYTCTHR